MVTTREHETFWVCTDCYFTHHYGRESIEEPPDREPLGLIDRPGDLSAGLMADEHDTDCPVWLGDPNRPDVPTTAECDCERRTFTWQRCEGCGSTLGGSREALTYWDPKEGI
jgi:hypothetical protein